LGRAERVGRLDARHVRARVGPDAVAVEPGPADRPLARADSAGKRLGPGAGRVADRNRHYRRMGESEADPEQSPAAMDDNSGRTDPQVAERPGQIEEPLHLRLP